MIFLTNLMTGWNPSKPPSPTTFHCHQVTHMTHNLILQDISQASQQEKSLLIIMILLLELGLHQAHNLVLHHALLQTLHQAYTMALWNINPSPQLVPHLEPQLELHLANLMAHLLTQMCLLQQANHHQMNLPPQKP